MHARDFPVMGCLTRVPTDHRQKASVWPPPRHSFRLLSCSSQQREGFSAGLRVQPGAGLGPADVSRASGGGSVGETPVGGWILKAALATLRSSGVPWDRTGFRQWRQGQLWGFSGSCKMAGESGPGCWMLAGDLLLTLRADGGQRLCPDHRSQPSFRAVEGRDEQLGWVRSGSRCFIQRLEGFLCGVHGVHSRTSWRGPAGKLKV